MAVVELIEQIAPHSAFPWSWRCWRCLTDGAGFASEEAAQADANARCQCDRREEER